MNLFIRFDGQDPSNNHQGFTLIEAMVALLILTFGILAVGLMQQRSIVANHSAFSRTSSNAVATSFIEALKGMSFDSSLLTATSDLTVDNATHTFTATSDIPLFEYMYAVDNTEIVDQTNRRYTVRWAVVDNAITASEVPSKTIRLYVDWSSMMGAHQLILSTVKYNNESTL